MSPTLRPDATTGEHALTGGFPLSAAQRGIWFAQHLLGDVPLTIAQYLDVCGRFDAPVFADAAADAETALWLWRSILTRRSAEGWELMDLLDEGLSNARAAERRGISAPAVSQRLGRAARTEGIRGEALTSRLLSRLNAICEMPES